MAGVESLKLPYRIRARRSSGRAITALISVLVVCTTLFVGPGFSDLMNSIGTARFEEVFLMGGIVPTVSAFAIALGVRFLAPFALGPLHHIGLSSSGIVYRRLMNRQSASWDRFDGFGALPRVVRGFNTRSLFEARVTWFVVGGMAVNRSNPAEKSYPFEIDVRSFTGPFHDEAQVAAEIALWLNEALDSTRAGELSALPPLPGALIGLGHASRHVAAETTMNWARVDTEIARRRDKLAPGAGDPNPAAAPLHIDPKTDEVVEAGGSRRQASDEELSRYWDAETNAALKTGDGEAAEKARWKSKFHRNRARLSRKQQESGT
jgi:hypothetical protein